MTEDDAFKLINYEYESDDALLLKFRMSDDVDPKRIQAFLEALEVVTEFYEGRAMVSKSIAYRINSFRSTLSASAGHWKVARPKGLPIKTTTALIIALSGVFASR